MKKVVYIWNPFDGVTRPFFFVKAAFFNQKTIPLNEWLFLMISSTIFRSCLFIVVVEPCCCHETRFVPVIVYAFEREKVAIGMKLSVMLQWTWNNIYHLTIDP